MESWIFDYTPANFSKSKYSYPRIEKLCEDADFNLNKLGYSVDRFGTYPRVINDEGLTAYITYATYDIMPYMNTTVLGSDDNPDKAPAISTSPCLLSLILSEPNKMLNIKSNKIKVFTFPKCDVLSVFFAEPGKGTVVNFEVDDTSIMDMDMGIDMCPNDYPFYPYTTSPMENWITDPKPITAKSAYD